MENQNSYPARREFSQLGFNHSTETDLLAKVRSKSPDNFLPFLLDGFVDHCIAIVDDSLSAVTA